MCLFRVTLRPCVRKSKNNFSLARHDDKSKRQFPKFFYRDFTVSRIFKKIAPSISIPSFSTICAVHGQALEILKLK